MTTWNVKGISFSANLAEIVCKSSNGDLYQLKDLDPKSEYSVTVYHYDKDSDNTDFLREFCGKVEGVSKDTAIEMRKQLNAAGYNDYTLLFKGDNWLGEPTVKADSKSKAKAPATEEIPF